MKTSEQHMPPHNPFHIQTKGTNNIKVKLIVVRPQNIKNMINE